MQMPCCVSLCLAVLISTNTDEIIETLTADEQTQIASLSASKQLVIKAILSDKPIPYRKNWNGVKKGDVFRVKKMQVYVPGSKLGLIQNSSGVSVSISISNFFIADSSVIVTNWKDITSTLISGDVLPTDGVIFECVGEHELLTTGSEGVKKTFLPHLKVIKTEGDVGALAEKIAEARGYHAFKTGISTYRVGKAISVTNDSARLQYLGSARATTVPMERFAEGDQLWLKNQIVE